MIGLSLRVSCVGVAMSAAACASAPSSPSLPESARVQVTAEAFDGDLSGVADRDTLFRRLDANSDGVLTRWELPDRGGPDFVRLDLDQNGVVTRDEFDDVTGEVRRR